MDTNADDIDQAPFVDFDYNEMDGGVDDHGGEDEVDTKRANYVLLFEFELNCRNRC